MIAKVGIWPGSGSTTIGAELSRFPPAPQVDYEAACVSNMIKNLMTSAGECHDIECHPCF